MGYYGLTYTHNLPEYHNNDSNKPFRVGNIIRIEILPKRKMLRFINESTENTVVIEKIPF